MRKILLTIGLPLSLLAVVSCADHAKQESVTTQEVESVEVKAADAEKDTTVEQAETDTWNIPASSSNGKQISFNGIIMMPPKSHSVVTLTMGGSLESLPVFTGDYVKKGQIIATLRNPDFIQLQQEYLTASAQVEYLEKEYQRQQNLAQKEAASQKRLQQSKAEYLSEKSKLEAAKAQLALLNVDTEQITRNGIMTYLEVKAPIGGYITEMQANVGQYFEAGTPVCGIINKAETMLLLTAYEKDLATIAVGDQVEFTVNGIVNELYQAEITAIDQMVNNENRSINVYAKVKKTDSLFRQGMYVSAKTNKNK